MKRRIYIAAIIILILLLGVGGCRKAGVWLVKDDHPEHADVLVMLMGNITDRVLEVADLYMGGIAGRVWIVEPYDDEFQALGEKGVNMVTDTDRAMIALIGLGIPRDSIKILSGNASSTQMEAQIVRDYLMTTGSVDTLILVSSSSHTRRGYNIFRAAFKPMADPPVLSCSPSTYSGFHAEKWWKNREDIQDVVLEYLKMTNFFLFEKRKLKSEN